MKYYILFLLYLCIYFICLLYFLNIYMTPIGLKIDIQIFQVSEKRWMISFRYCILSFLINSISCQACNVANAHIMSCIAMGLGLAPNYFDKMIDKEANTLRLLHYPSIPVTEKANRAGCVIFCSIAFFFFCFVLFCFVLFFLYCFVLFF
jgi:hypothetical protein